MNIILFDKEEIIDNHVFLSDHRAKHIVKILHSEVGDSLRVGVINGNSGIGKIVRLEKKFPFTVKLAVSLTKKLINQPVVDLILALPRPIMLKRILSQVTALGVGRIYIINAARVEKSFWKSGVLEPAEYIPHLLHGLEQAVDTRLPHIKICTSFKSFVEEKLAERKVDYSNLLLAHPSVRTSLSSCIQDKKGRVLYAIGPEGGWLEYELEMFERAGMKSFSIGSRILKVDTAIVAIHGRIMQVLEQ